MSTVTCQRCGKVEENRATAAAKYCLNCHRRGKPKPTRAGRLIHQLIEERAKVIALISTFGDADTDVPVAEHQRNQARREIEQEVLCPK